METMTIIYLFFISVIMASGLIFVLIKWHNEYNNRIALEKEYDKLLERSILICDELSKSEELVITQNEIIKEKDQEFRNLKRTQCGFCGGH